MKAPSYYAFRAGEEISEGFRRIIKAIAGQAQGILSHQEFTTEDVHDARLLIKRLRALLWFASSVFPQPIAGGIKQELRRAAHLLAHQRDLEAVGSLLARISEGALHFTQHNPPKATTDKDDRQEREFEVQEALKIVLKQIECLEMSSHAEANWPLLDKRVDRAIRCARKAGKWAIKNRASGDFHLWRKRAKRLLYQLQLISNPRPRVLRFSKHVDKLQEKLGDYHDVVMAQEHLQGNEATATPPKAVEASLHALKKRKQHLRRRIQDIAHEAKLC